MNKVELSQQELCFIICLIENCQLTYVKETLDDHPTVNAGVLYNKLSTMHDRVED